MKIRRMVCALLGGAIASIACAAVAEAQNVPAAAFGALRYRAIGPAIAGGRTPAVVGSDRSPLVYYAGGADGGVFKSTDGGASWNAIFERASSAAIGALALGATDADLWVGTGESNPRNDVESGDGLWHTTDGGASWRHAGLADAGQISSISVDPRDPRTVVVGALGPVFRDGTTRGVFVTRDGGTTWKRTLYAGPSAGISDIVRIPGHPATLFAGVYQFSREPWMMTSGGPAGGIYRSDDGGTTWRRVTGGGLPPSPVGRIGLSASGGRIYAIVQSSRGELWRSDDGGSTWQKMPRSPYVGARPFYFSRIFADPQDPNRVVAVGLILAMSTDGGRTFHPIAENAGWDYHQVWWSHDGRRLIVGNDEGAVLSADRGVHWWQPYDLPFAQPYRVGLGATVPDYDVCVGLQDNNSWCGRSQVFNTVGVLNRDWSIAGPGDGMWAVIDPVDPNYVWTTSTNSDTGQVYLWNRKTQQTADVSPYARANADAPASLAYRFNWDAPVTFTNDPQPKALTGGNVVFESSDRGQHWTAISPDLTRNEKSHQLASGKPIDLDVSGAETSDTILDIGVSSLATGTYWVGTDDGLVQLTRDGGAHWSNVTPPGIAPWGRFSTVEPGHFAPGTAFAAYDRHMLGDAHPYAFVTDDYGATWHAIANGLPQDQFVRSIRQDRRNADLLYAGTQRGVWVSFDRGAHWQSLRLNMPATAVYDLETHPLANDLVVAAHGRGVWILDDLTPLQQSASIRSASPVLFAPRDAYRMFQAAPVNAFAGGLPDNEFVGENPPYGALLTYYLPAAAAHAAIEIVDACGGVRRHLGGDDVPAKAGLNRTAWDLSEDGPVLWKGTFKENQGPKEGPEAIPAPYTVRLVVDGRTFVQPLTVKPDPRDPTAASSAAARHDFLAEIYGELSAVDAALNAIDRALPTAPPAKAAALRALARTMAMHPRNTEDLGAPPGLRDRLLDMLARMGSSFQPPTGAEQTEAQALRSDYQSVMTQYRAALAGGGSGETYDVRPSCAKGQATPSP